MKKALIVILIALCPAGIWAQKMPYPTDTIKGQVFYRYPVQKSEGLYRISKNFGVSQEDIVKYNPALQTSGLKLGQVILIPCIEPTDSSKYIIHELQPKETLYGLSKRYGVRIARIQELNPETSKRMAIGSRLLIPREEKAEVTTPQAESTTPKPESTTPKPESTTPPAAPQKDTTVMQPLKLVPVILNTTPEAAKPDTTVADTALPAGSSTAITQPDTQLRELPIRIAFLLPLMANSVKRDANSDRFLEFYEGALLAVYEAQERGQTFELYTFDTEKADIHIRQQLALPEMQNMDAVIGPAYPSQVSIASAFCYENHVPVLVPFTQKVSDLQRNPWLLQFNPSEQQEAEAVCNALAAEKEQVNFVCFDDEDNTAPTSVRLLKQTLAAQGFSITQTTMERLMNDSVKAALVPERRNILLFNTEKYSGIQPLMPRIEELSHSDGVELFSHYAWQKEQIPVKQLYTSVFNPTKPFDLRLLAYSAAYKRWFGHELQNKAPRYDLLGYDLTCWLIRMLQQDPDMDAEERITRTQWEGLQSDIRFLRPNPQGGYENTALRLLEK